MKRICDWVTIEMARRKVQFHLDEKWDSIRLWALFYKSNIRRHLKNGWLVPHNPPYGFRCLGWYYPSDKYWESSIKPLVNAIIENR